MHSRVGVAKLAVRMSYVAGTSFRSGSETCPLQIVEERERSTRVHRGCACVHSWMWLVQAVLIVSVFRA